MSDLCNSVVEISQATQIAKQEADERQRIWDIQREKDRREAEERRRAKNLKDSQDELSALLRIGLKLNSVMSSLKKPNFVRMICQMRTVKLLKVD